LVTTPTDGSSAVPTQLQIVQALKDLVKSGAWGYSLVKSLIQDLDDETAVLESIEDTVLQPDQTTLLYPIFRLILQLMHDSGKQTLSNTISIMKRLIT
jgi:squalene cyclase